MGKIKHPSALKTIYKKLIKKYHPDQFPEHRHMNSWMAEINGLYQQNISLKKMLP
jgi:DnaJ-class molecular chaperone